MQSSSTHACTTRSSAHATNICITNPTQGTYQLWLWQDGRMAFRYPDILGTDLARGSSATIGLQSAGGVRYTNVAFEIPTLVNGEAITLKFETYGGDYIATRNATNVPQRLLVAPDDAPGHPQLISPGLHASLPAGLDVTFNWSLPSGSPPASYGYLLLVSGPDDPNFATLTLHEPHNYQFRNDSANSNGWGPWQPPALPVDATYFVRLIACNPGGCGAACASDFTVLASLPGPSPSPSPSASPFTPRQPTVYTNNITPTRWVAYVHPGKLGAGGATEHQPTHEWAAVSVTWNCVCLNDESSDSHASQDKGITRPHNVDPRFRCRW